MRFLQVFEIHKLKFSVKQKSKLALWDTFGGDPRKVREPLKKCPCHKKNSPFFGFLSFSNFCIQNQISLNALNSRFSWPKTRVLGFQSSNSHSRFLQVLEIHTLKLSVKQTCHLGTLFGDPRKVREPLKKCPCHKKNSPFLGSFRFRIPALRTKFV